MFINFVSPVEGERGTLKFYRDKAVPKKEEGAIDVVVDGTPCKLYLRGSRSWATAGTAGLNGWFKTPKLTGYVLFSAGFEPKAGTEFTTSEAGSDKRPLRDPKNPEGEKARRNECRKTFKANHPSWDVSDPV